MNKSLVSAVALLSLSVSLFAASVVSAQAVGQTYYPPYTPAAYSNSTGCVTLNRDLTVGMRGSDVTSLQSFLVAQNYPGSGSWMITGYFGAATQAAVRNFQSQRGLVQTGIADSATRSAIGNCGASNYPYTTPFSYNYNYNYGYNYPYNYPVTGAVHIDTLSVTSAVTGASVTISGRGFDYNNNTVFVGSTPVTGIASYSGSSLSFVVPQNVSGLVMVYVANSRGASNSLQLNVINFTGGSGCVYPYNTGYGNCGGCGMYGIPCPNAQLAITSLSPDNGAVGSQVTVYGSGFTTSGNTVRFGNGIIANIGSQDGRAISFAVPANMTGYNNIPVGLGTYPVSVTNASGYTSNTLPFTVNALGGTNAPTISNVSGPSTLSTGVTGTWTLNILTGQSTYTNVSVRWGDEGMYGYSASAPQNTNYTGNQTFTFTHSYATSGTYTVTFTVSNLSGKSNTATATVVVSGSGSGQITLTSIAPSSGRVGTQVILQGSGFTTYDNTVHFGIGGTQHVVSQNGSQIYYTIPAYLSPCDVLTSGMYCAAYAQQVTPGQYQVYVQNTLGQTGQLTFTVTL
ncbi:hypothetical protein A3C20_00105 [Candidatus Kaiserbacteria bacterium RIFCSPHIGHO2_02_FULL_55_25]|uniref:PKD domain-containing protein n=1 Tax=Candidatus Kaiserbacteria bacterium RIFCSPHIGHO2_02_FULL_55_25 TaxID=1798498 RepID=A0A1F6E7R0_9BACT|nr:MAG: hypothetical protein A2764_01675 [Candidatus Kaiserbacteria bacterium RIFCSPHIGHO2_01_FULL_55_79]OGG69755.1 MAG: hypothetical protein A3C20_00105 [Candidatus Kaiserbacteria bacterium RIFCSPHIGHO2_02_FULL_55_25]OGG77564.1 MAG: hypothetical protein A3F56_02025 [Candidatus Kaiserbacteria bacterium RIFCSPHIGHO2_12_FULL_55_13]OGG83198.1 MAG: hypothetical protein A3A42_01380 [Candidatus Kaiserbacteria bacterium RIFCSPLOWO2_01_FULL_55_25]